MKYLIDDRPLIVLPGLAKLLGSVERALVLQQIHWLLNQPRSGVERDGEKWVYGTYEEWCGDYFTMWEPRTLQGHILWLEKANYLISAQLEAKDYNRRKFYRVNYAALDDKPGDQTASDSARSNMHDHAPSIVPDHAPSIVPDHARSYIRNTETSSETSSKTSTDNNVVGRRQLDAGFASVCRGYESEVGVLTPVVSDDLGAMVDEYGEALTLDAIRQAARNNKRTISYIRGILANWKREGRRPSSPAQQATGATKQPATITVAFALPDGTTEHRQVEVMK